MSNEITLVFSGPSGAKFFAVQELLNDWLGFGEQDDEGYYEPSTRDVNVTLALGSGLYGSGMDSVLQWTARADLPLEILVEDGFQVDEEYAEAVDSLTEVPDVAAAVIEELSKVKHDKALVLLWGDGSEEAEALLDLALEAGIPVKDLSSGLDDLVFEKPDEAPEPEPEPAPKPSRGRRQAPKAVEPLEDEEEEASDEDPAPTAKDPEPTSANAAEEIYVELHRAAVLLKEAGQVLGGVYDTIFGPKEGTAATQEPEEEAQAVYRPVPKPASEEPAEPRKSRGRPRKDGSPAQPRETISVLMDEDGEYHKRGRGRPRKGQEIVEISIAEYKEYFGES